MPKEDDINLVLILTIINMKEIKKNELNLDFKPVLKKDFRKKVYLRVVYMHGDANFYDIECRHMKNMSCNNIDDFVITPELQEYIDNLIFLNKYIDKVNCRKLTYNEACEELKTKHGDKLFNLFEETVFDKTTFDNLCILDKLNLIVFDANENEYMSRIYSNNYR